MKCVELNKNWKYLDRPIFKDVSVDTAAEVDLPIDFLCAKPRNYNLPYGAFNSYYDSATVTMLRTLPTIEKAHKIYLDFDGVSGIASVYINDVFCASISNRAHIMVDITAAYDGAAKNVLKLVITSPAETGKYIGLGIAGGVRLLAIDSSVFVQPDGVFVSCAALDERARLRIATTLVNDTDEAKRVIIEALVYNAKNKRVARKIKKVKIAAHFTKTFEMYRNMRRHYDWCETDPYMYECAVNIYDENNFEQILDSAGAKFGIVNIALKNRALYLNNKKTYLNGAVMARDNGLLGNASEESAEKFKLSRVKEIGYNAVRYVGAPTKAALDALDKLGIMAVVDLFDCFSQGEFPFDGHIDFEKNWRDEVDCVIKALRNHPSVVMYSLGNDILKKSGGENMLAAIAERVKKLDATRPLTALIRVAGAKTSDSEFAKSAESFAALDVCGYGDLHARYDDDRQLTKPIIGLKTSPIYAFDAVDAMRKSYNVIGDFKFVGADYLGYPLGIPELNVAQMKLLPAHSAYCGDLDITYGKKEQAYYHQIIAGDRSVSLITSISPDSACVSDEFVALRAARNMWNMPRFLGKQVEVQVYSGGEVVALYLDGKLIGRKLAGRVNKHIATFKTEYYPGKLEAVSFHKGVECSRTCLESALSPRAIKTSVSAKTIDCGELTFVEITVVDKDNRLVGFANREIEVSVLGEGKLVALGNGDPENQTRATSTCPVYNGKALAVVRGVSDGKISVKITSEGLLSSKLSIRVKADEEK